MPYAGMLDMELHANFNFANLQLKTMEHYIRWSLAEMDLPLLLAGAAP